MAPNREMIEAFVDGRLSAPEHELMVHHISSCTECAAAVIAALAEAARALHVEANGRANAATVESNETAVPLSPVVDLNQLDLILGSASADASGLLFKAEPVEEISLDELPPRRPPARPASTADAMPFADFSSVSPESPPADGLADGVADAVQEPADVVPVEVVRELETVVDAELVEAVAVEEAELLVEEPVVEEPPAVDTELPAEPPSVDEPDVEEIATATAAGVAESVAHGAAALAASVEELAPQPESPAPKTVHEPAPEVFDGEIPEAEPAELVAEGSWEEAEAAVATEPDLVAAEVEPPTEPRDERIPDEERAAIAAAVRANTGAEVPPRRRSSTALALAAVFLVFIGVASVAAVQLRGFMAEVGSPPEAVRPELAAVEPEPPSVLEELLDAGRVGFITDVGADSIALVAAESLVVPDTAVPAVPAAPAAPRPAEVPAARPPPSGVSAGTRAAPRPRVQGISPEPTAGARLLRTTTHRVSPDLDFVLREYEAASPAPAPREGVNEYRWTDAAAGRLFVLSGPATVADLRSYARRLQNGGTDER